MISVIAASLLWFTLYQVPAQKTVPPPITAMSTDYCSSYGKKVASSVISSHSFTVATKDRCWDYCRSMTSCTHFSFNYRKLQCNLYHSAVVVELEDARSSMVGWKGCNLSAVPCLKLNQVIGQASPEKDSTPGLPASVYIKYSIHDRCLGVDYSTDDGVAPLLNFGSCHGAPAEWIITTAPQKSDESPQSEEPEMPNTVDVKISLKGTSRCLQWNATAMMNDFK